MTHLTCPVRCWSLGTALLFLMAGVGASLGANMAQAGYGPAAQGDDLAALSQQAISADPAVATPAIAALRARGPEGLAALLATHRALAAKALASGGSLCVATPGSDPAAIRLAIAADAIGAQRDCLASGLYWYTDLEQAKAQARATGRPILSLRLFGKLSDELSCANSRYFRTVLYADKEVADTLRSQYVLHWQSVRPVPRITIDFGDGRKIERTITGNSIHYVLDQDGRVVDALPGLYGAKAFLRGLAAARQAAVKSGTMDTPQRVQFLRAYHQESLAELTAAWQADLAQVRPAMANAVPGAYPGAGERKPAAAAGIPTAEAAAGRVESKSAVEVPILRATDPAGMPVVGDLDDAPLWQKIAALHAADARLDAGSRAMVGRKMAVDPEAAMRRAMSKRVVEDPMLRVVRVFEANVALDTVRNEYQMHAKIHQWLANQVDAAVSPFNERVYAELFLTPSSDPWLGLAPPDAYAALDGAGLVLSGK